MARHRRGRRQAEELRSVRVVQVPLGGPDTSPVAVNERTVSGLSAVWCAVGVISEACASLPIHLYRRTGAGTERVESGARGVALNEVANGCQPAFPFWEQQISALLLHGNSYAQVTYGEGGAVELWPLHPATVRPAVDSGRLRYEIDEGQELDGAEVLHCAINPQGVVGRGVITVARASLECQLHAERNANRWFKNGLRISGVFTVPGKLTDEARRASEERWEGRYHGTENAHRVPILDSGASFVPMSLSAKDQQFLETRQFGVTEVARWFKIPPHLIGDLSRATFSNIEQQQLNFWQMTLRPLLRRVEQVLNWRLLTPAERSAGYYWRYNPDAILAADTASRYAAHSSAIQAGWKTINEVRALEGMNAVAGGDTVRSPLHSAPIETPAAGAAVSDGNYAEE